MLQTLKIKNIALIENVSIDFNLGLNVFTGETGAGKTIILDSLNFLLGARADKSLIRHGENFAKVDALFNIDLSNNNIKLLLEKFNIPIEEQILISRTMSIDGKNEIRINGEIVSLSMLKEITSNLVDIYGQNEQLNILKPKYQLSLLDNLSNDIFNLANNYKELKHRINEINEKLSALGDNQAERERELDLLSYQLNEIEKANLREDEEKELIEKKNILANIEKISSLLITANNYMNSLVDNSNVVKSNIANCTKYDNTLNDLYSRLESSVIELEDIESEISNYMNKLNFNETELDNIEERLEIYKNLQRKYGKTVNDIFNFYILAKERYNKLINSDAEINKLNKEKQLLLNEIFKVAEALSNKRKEVSKSLEEKIKQNLKNLGMAHAEIIFKFEDYEQIEQNLLSNGCDNVEILFSANKGETAMPLKNVASGGEMSRIMLAIKSIIADTDNMPTMIFDEIDTGISGLMAQAVAIELAKISKNHQIILITHTAQIASIADTNYLVEKFEEDNRTYSNITKLTNEQKVIEIARFLSNIKNSTYALENAKHLIDEQNRLKQSL